MTLSLILAFLWVVAATITAMLPMRRQFIPGFVLLIVSVPMLIFVGYENGWWVALVALAGAASMFRKPLNYFGRRAMGKPVSVPKEFRRNDK